MPIYAYKCESCGHRQDVLQKISDPVLTQCPSCGAAAFAKQLTAAGFQLKGSGWYATDFKNGNAVAKPATKDEAKTEGSDATKPAESVGADKANAAPAEPAKSTLAKAAPAATPAGPPASGA
jgi:putative FmdB family regulatory protein